MVLEGEDAERIVDLMNSFVVVSEKESGGGGHRRQRGVGEPV